MQKRIILFAKVTNDSDRKYKKSSKKKLSLFLSPKNYFGEYTMREIVCLCVSLM